MGRVTRALFPLPSLRTSSLRSKQNERDLCGGESAKLNKYGTTQSKPASETYPPELQCVSVRSGYISLLYLLVIIYMYTFSNFYLPSNNRRARLSAATQGKH